MKQTRVCGFFAAGIIWELTEAATDTGYGGTDSQTGSGADAEAIQSREDQGYGSGSGVGA